MKATKTKAVLLGALLDHYRLRDLVLRHFERTAARGDTVRCSAVDERVAAALRVDLSPMLRRRVRHAAKLAGFDWITRPQGVPNFRFMKARA